MDIAVNASACGKYCTLTLTLPLPDGCGDS